MAELYVVGIGPGAYEKMTVEAEQVLRRCPVIAGYQVYIELIREYFPQKNFLATAMRQEEERCRMALDAAQAGVDTAMICSGDSGVYGMAGLILQLLEEGNWPDVKVQIIPGVTAALAGGALLGAPLTNDFAVISLSDLLTPAEEIQKRLRGAAIGDFVVCIYNPSSRKRKDYLKKACEILLEYRNPDTVCGLVSQIGRQGQRMEILTLNQLKDRETDMFTTVFIGNSRTRKIGKYMVTPRGYRLTMMSGEEERQG